MAEMDRELANKVALSCNILAKEGQADMTFGHVSARLAGQDHMHMSPFGLDLEDVRTEDILLADFEGNKLLGERRPRTEFPIHAEIYKLRKEINSIVHTHPTFSIILSAIGGELHPISHEAALFSDVPLFKETTELIRTPDRGKAVAKCLGQAPAVLLQNHGIVTVGRSVEEATVYAILLERAARIELLARQAGVQVWCSEEERRHIAEQTYHTRGVQNIWEYFVRRVKLARP